MKGVDFLENKSEHSLNILGKLTRGLVLRVSVFHTNVTIATQISLQDQLQWRGLTQENKKGA